jgi:hypothetical protein
MRIGVGLFTMLTSPQSFAVVSLLIRRHRGYVRGVWYRDSLGTELSKVMCNSVQRQKELQLLIRHTMDGVYQS